MDRSVGTTERARGLQQIQSYGFREVVNSNRHLVLDPTDLPWLPQPEGKAGVAVVPLARITTQAGEQFYLGSAIKTKELEEAARGMDVVSGQANKLFYAEVQRFLQNPHSTAFLEHPKTKNSGVPRDKQRDIYYAAAANGMRVYFMRFNVDRVPAILRIASGFGKNSESDILDVISTDNRREIKRRCLGR